MLNTKSIIQNSIGLVLGIFLNYKYIDKSPITLLPIELMFFILTLPFYRQVKSYSEYEIVNDIIHTGFNTAFYLHLIRFLYRMRESVNFTINNLLLTLVVITTLYFNKIIIDNNILNDKLYILLIIINGCLQFLSYYKNKNKNNVLFNPKIDIPITIGLLIFTIFKKKLKINLGKYKETIFYTDLVYHILEIVNWGIHY
jgi:hypothetical protein